MKIGPWELVVILAIALLIFGPKSLPKLGEAFGKTIGSFKKGLEADNDEEEDKPQKTKAAVKSDAGAEEGETP